MISQNYFNAWKESRAITFQIVETMKNDSHFKLDFKPHPEMNSFGKTASHLVKADYHMLKNYMKLDNIEIPDYLGSEADYEAFKKGLEATDKLVTDLFTTLTNEDLEQEAYYWEPTKRSYSKGWVVHTLINHERWTQAQLKMYLKLMGCNTDDIGH